MQAPTSDRQTSGVFLSGTPEAKEEKREPLNSAPEGQCVGCQIGSGPAMHVPYPFILHCGFGGLVSPPGHLVNSGYSAKVIGSRSGLTNFRPDWFHGPLDTSSTNAACAEKRGHCVTLALIEMQGQRGLSLGISHFFNLTSFG